jgi:2-polyprenyl-3-methyl-5-hydroxy-6-metoxy-1,4-benzoquinol methylase
MDLREENAISGDPSAHWYYISKGRAIKALLGARPIEKLLDVSAGSGVFSKMLVNEGCAAEATCLDPNYADEFIGKRRTDKVAYVRNVDAVEADTVLMIDVLEHEDDDVGLLRDYVHRAEPGTRFVISVPAFQFLWSPQDDYLERRRRYRLSDLRRTVEAAGLAPLRMRYFFGLLFPAAAVMRLAEKNNQNDAPASQLKSAPDWLNKSLIAIHKLECAALFPLNQLAGVTAFCLAEKPAALAQGQKAA